MNIYPGQASTELAPRKIAISRLQTPLFHVKYLILST